MLRPAVCETEDRPAFSTLRRPEAEKLVSIQPLDLIRNFCIVAHIDHGKSTLADRFLDLTHAVAARQMREQYLDRMDLERERGITIKAQAVRLRYTPAGSAGEFELNLIDTPGHVDFSYEVSRSLAACEGAILLVDAAQGIEAQTLANFHLARDAGLVIVPAVNKIDLPAADPDETVRELAELLGCPEADVLRVSAKSGAGVTELLEAVIARVPPPSGDRDAPLRALIFDSTYDAYRGVIAYLRVVDGRLASRARIRYLSTGHGNEAEEVGVFAPDPIPVDELVAGDVGYLVTGVKDVRQAQVGDTITTADRGAPSRSTATASRSRWCGAGCIPRRAATTRCCAMRSTSCGCPTPRSSTSLSPPSRSASDSDAVSSGCSTWRSSRSASSASSASS